MTRFILSRARPPRSSISHLLRSSGPFAVLRSIGAVIINSFNGQAVGWARPHVSEEILVRISPTGANEDSSASIVFVGSALWIFTALFYALPDLVFWPISVGLSVVWMAQTAAGGRESFEQGAVKNLFGFPTDAMTEPVSSTTGSLAFSLSEYDQPPKLAMGEIDYSHGRPKFIGAFTRTGGFLSKFEASRVGKIINPANWADSVWFSFHGITIAERAR